MIYRTLPAIHLYNVVDFVWLIIPHEVKTVNSRRAGETIL
jgi:hypothetical protein